MCEVAFELVNGIGYGTDCLFLHYHNFVNTGFRGAADYEWAVE